MAIDTGDVAASVTRNPRADEPQALRGPLQPTISSRPALLTGLPFMPFRAEHPLDSAIRWMT
jgi:hypothetical protein